jgi:hypothetical protein
MGRLEQQIAAVLAALAAHWAPMLAIGQDLFEDFLGIFCCSAMPAISIGTLSLAGREPRVCGAQGMLHFLGDHYRRLNTVSCNAITVTLTGDKQGLAALSATRPAESVAKRQLFRRI